MELSTIVNLAYLIITGFFVFIGLIVGLSRGTIKSFSRLVCLVLSAFLAMIAVNMLLNNYGTEATQAVMNEFDVTSQIPAEAIEIMEISPTLSQYASVLVLGLVAPIVFLLLFIVFALVSFILGWIINLILKALFAGGKTKPSGASRLVGMFLSILCGIVISCSLLMPFTGYLYKAGEVYEQLETQEVITTDSEEGEQVAEVLKGFKNSIVGKLENAATGWMFEKVTSYKTESGVESSVSKDIDTFVGVVPAVMNLQTLDFNDVENIDVTPIRDMVAAIEPNETIRAIIAEIMSYAGDKWYHGEEFLGVNLKEQLPDGYKNSLDSVLQKLSVTTKETVIDDLNEFIDEIEGLAKAYPAFLSFSESDFSNPATVNLSSLSAVIDAIEGTTYTKAIIAEVMASAGNDWANGSGIAVGSESFNLENELPAELKGVLQPFYEFLATTTTENVIEHLREFVSLFEDVQALYTKVEALTEQDFGGENFHDVDVAPLYELADYIANPKANLTKQIVASFISNAGRIWREGGEFMGMNFKAELPDDYKDSFDSAFETMETATAENLGDVLTSFAQTIDSIAKTYNYVSLLQSTSDVNELAASLTTVLTSVTPNNVELLTDVVSDVIKDAIGVDEATAQAVTGIVNSALEKIAVSNAQEVLSEVLSQDAEAINSLLNYVSANENLSSLTADDVIDTVINSGVIAQTIREYVVGEGAMTITLGETEKSEVSNAISNYIEQNPQITEEQTQTLNAIKALFGIA